MARARILIGCEISGRVRDAFNARGLDAWSCDLRPSRSGGPHILGDVLSVLGWDCWHAAIVFPPCQYLARSGLHWNGRVEGRDALTAEAVDFVRAIMAARVPMLAIENPSGRIGTAIRPADQLIQPYQFREDASKATCLWLRGLPLLRPTGWVHGRMIFGRERWSNQTDSGNNRLPQSKTRADKRAATFPGVADAMAAQWAPWIVSRVRWPDVPALAPCPPDPAQLALAL